MAGPFPRGLPPNRAYPFPSTRLSGDYCVHARWAFTEDTLHRFGVPHSAYLPTPGCPNHLAPFALWAAFPPSLAGRDSGDYYEASVAIGLASRRRSHVHPGHTC